MRDIAKGFARGCAFGLLIALVAVACVEIGEQNLTGSQDFDRNDGAVTGPTPLPTDPTAPPVSSSNQLVITDGPPDENVITSQTINIGSPSTVKVIACSVPVGTGPCPVSAEVPTEGLQVNIRTLTPDPANPVAVVKEISGRFVSFSGITPGTAEATFRANGQARAILLTVQ